VYCGITVQQFPFYLLVFPYATCMMSLTALECVYYFTGELKQHKLWFDKWYELLDRRKQSELQLLQNPSQMNGYYMVNVRCEASVTFQDQKQGNIWKTKLMSLKQTVRRNIVRDLYRGLSEFKKCYQLISNVLKDGNGGLLVADSWQYFE
jgi:hypothetical protein